MKSKLIRLVTVLSMAVSLAAAASSVYSVPGQKTRGSGLARPGIELTSHGGLREDYWRRHPYQFRYHRPQGYLEYRRYYPGFYPGYRYRPQPFPYQCGPFFENRPYGYHGYGGYRGNDERCVYPYYRQYNYYGRDGNDYGPALLRLSNDAAVAWIAPDAVQLIWDGNVNGVTAVEFALLDDDKVSLDRILVDYPPYSTVVYVPYKTEFVRVRTYGLLGSILYETVSPLPLP